MLDVQTFAHDCVVFDSFSRAAGVVSVWQVCLRELEWEQQFWVCSIAGRDLLFHESFRL